LKNIDNSCLKSGPKKEPQYKGVYINGCNGVQQHINCNTRTTVKDLRLLMAKNWELKAINVFFFYHGKPLLDNIEVGGYFTFSL
jgi:hypothetical protein